MYESLKKWFGEPLHTKYCIVMNTKYSGLIHPGSCHIKVQSMTFWKVGKKFTIGVEQ